MGHGMKFIFGKNCLGGSQLVNRQNSYRNVLELRATLRLYCVFAIQQFWLKSCTCFR